MYEKDESYLKAMPPEPVGSNTTLVHLGIDILAILEISEVDSYISMQISIQLTWYECQFFCSTYCMRNT